MKIMENVRILDEISVVIPVFNELESLPELKLELSKI